MIQCTGGHTKELYRIRVVGFIPFQELEIMDQVGCPYRKNI